MNRDHWTHALFIQLTKKEARTYDPYNDYEIIADPLLPIKPWFQDRIDEEGNYPVLMRKVIAAED